MSARPPVVPTPELVQHLAATRRRWIEQEGRAPRVLAIGRWDARELARYCASLGWWGSSPKRFLRFARSRQTFDGRFHIGEQKWIVTFFIEWMQKQIAGLPA